MEITMQWWDDADDLFYAFLLKIQALAHWTPVIAKTLILALAVFALG